MNSTQIRARRGAVRSLFAACLLALIGAWGAGCGQRGPLYLPESEPDASEEVTATGATPENGTADDQEPADGAGGEDQK